MYYQQMDYVVRSKDIGYYTKYTLFQLRLELQKLQVPGAGI